MIVTEPDPKTRLIDHYDFTFVNGFGQQITVDKDRGDSVDFLSHPSAVIIKLVERPAMSDPSVTLPAEEITIFTSHILSINHRVVETLDQTTAQRLEWAKVLQEVSGTIQ